MSEQWKATVAPGAEQGGQPQEGNSLQGLEGHNGVGGPPTPTIRGRGRRGGTNNPEGTAERVNFNRALAVCQVLSCAWTALSLALGHREVK